MAKVIMGIGIPGSGKTTLLKPLADKYSYTYISPDDIRAELTANAADQSVNREAWDEAYRRTADALKRGETIVFDATFAKGHERRDFIGFVRDNGAKKVQGIFAAVPLEVANERNLERERVVPSHAIQRMHESLKEDPPVIEDGFDSVLDINEFQELERGEIPASEERYWFKEFKRKPL